MPGSDAANASWPFYRLTSHGANVVGGLIPQSYDPTGFMAYFRAQNPNADPVITDYMDEAIRAFNHNCPKSSAVMMGAASEMAILLLHEKFTRAIADPAKRTKYEKDAANWTIASKYAAVKNRLDLMVAANKFSNELKETVRGELPGCFEVVRRQRNAAGHPEIVGSHDPDTVFINLRLMTEYVRRIYLLLDHFGSNPADW